MMTPVGGRAAEIWRVLKQGATEGWTTTKTTTALKEGGLSYRRIEMLTDIRRYASIARIREGELEKQNKVLDFFEQKIEPFRKAQGLTGEQAWHQRHDWETKRYKDLEEAEEMEEAGRDYGWVEEYP